MSCSSDQRRCHETPFLTTTSTMTSTMMSLLLSACVNNDVSLLSAWIDNDVSPLLSSCVNKGTSMLHASTTMYPLNASTNVSPCWIRRQRGIPCMRPQRRFPAPKITFLQRQQWRLFSVNNDVCSTLFKSPLYQLDRMTGRYLPHLLYYAKSSLPSSWPIMAWWRGSVSLWLPLPLSEV